LGGGDLADKGSASATARRGTPLARKKIVADVMQVEEGKGTSPNAEGNPTKLMWGHERAEAGGVNTSRDHFKFLRIKGGEGVPKPTNRR